MSKMSLVLKSVNKHMGFLMVLSSRLHESSNFDVFLIIFGKKKVSKMTSEKEEEEQEDRKNE